MKPMKRMDLANCVEPTNSVPSTDNVNLANCVPPTNCVQPTDNVNPTSCVQPTNWVYMVECRDGTLYTGWTTDLAKRVATHSAGRGAKYTRSRAPVRLVYAEACAGKSAALRREAAIKKLTRAQKLALAAGWQAGKEASQTENDLIFVEERYVNYRENSQEK